MKLWKICAIIFFVAVSVSVVAPVIGGEIYPIINLTFTVGVLMLFLLSHKDASIRRTFPLYLAAIVALSTVYRLRIFLFPASMLGIDPDRYAIQIARVMRSGDLSAITYGFYSEAPFHILEGSATGLIIAFPAPAASVVYPLLSGIAIPLLAIIFTARLRPNSPRTAILTAGCVSVLAYSVRFSYGPVAQTMGVLFLLFSIFSIFTYAYKDDRRWLILGLLMMIGAIYTHKLTAIAVTLSITGALVLGSLHPATRNTPTIKRLCVGGIGLMGLLTAVQLFYVTEFAQSIIFRLAVPSLPASNPPVPTAAVNPYSLTDRLFRLSYVVLLAIISGLVWLGWLWQTLRRQNFRQDILFLGFVAPLAGLIVIADPADMNPVRIISYSEVLLIVLIAVGWYWTAVESPGPSRPISRYVAISGILLLLVTAGVSSIAGPDAEPFNRDYLTSEEIKAKEWGYDMISGEIATDQYYAHETPPARIAVLEGAPSIELNKFEDRTSMFLNKSFSAEQPSAVAHRTCVKTIRSSYGPRQLTYDVEKVLSTTNNIYRSKCVSYYSAPLNQTIQ